MFSIDSVEDILNFRYKKNFKKWKYYEDLDLSKFDNYPKVFSYFKFCIIEDEKVLSNVLGKGTFCNTDNLDFLIKNIEKFKSEFLVLAGSDTRLSEVIDKLFLIKNNYNSIYFEAKDIVCDWVSSFPCGITYAYLLRCGEKNVTEVISSDIIKQKNVCACFGSKWPHLNNLIEDRKKLLDFVYCCDFVDFFICDPREYYNKISKYKFMLCPRGQGIQCPKLWESLLVETIPIVTKHLIYKDFEKYNLPFLIVDNWEDLRFMDIEKEYSKFKVNWTFVKSSILVSNFTNLL